MPDKPMTRMPFIIYGNQRTGSTLLASRLNSHPNIICHEEVFLPWLDSEPSFRQWLTARRYPQYFRVLPGTRRCFLDFLYTRNEGVEDINAIGFKIMYNQVSVWPKAAYCVPPLGELFRDPALGNWLQANQVLVIHMLRRNHLKIVASHLAAAQSGRFHSRDVSGPDQKVVISLRGLKARLYRIELAQRVAHSTISGLPSIEVCYEEYIGGHGKNYDDEICRALHLPVSPTGLMSPLQKVTSDNLRDVVKNYDQVAEHLSGTRFERFLD